jgi:uncharacterized caspase-like protein
MTMREALIVAVGDYQHESLRRLSTPLTDAEQLSTTLLDRTMGDFGRVHVLKNPSSPEFSSALERLFRDSSRKSTDTVVFYFSGHGVKDADGRLFLATSGTDPNLLRSTSIAAGFVHELMQGSPARTQIVILDCCFAGAFGRDLVKGGRDVGLVDQLPPSRGRVVLAGSSAIEFSFEDTAGPVADGKPSVFTDALITGLRTGAADLDGDGIITVDELFTYASDRLVDAAARQRPVKFAMEQDGQIPVARNPNREARTYTPLVTPRPVKRNPQRGRVAAIAALIALVGGIVWWVRRPDDVQAVTNSATTIAVLPTNPVTTAGGGGTATTTTIASATTLPKVNIPRDVREYPEVVGRSRTEAEQILQSKGWTTAAVPARVTDRPAFTVVGQLQNGDTVTVIVADVATCDSDPGKWMYCDGRPVANFRRTDALAANSTTLNVGQRLELTDTTAGIGVTRRWRWSQGGSSGYFTETTQVLSITVAGRAGDSLAITIEATNSKGHDEYTVAWKVA